MPDAVTTKRLNVWRSSNVTLFGKELVRFLSVDTCRMMTSLEQQAAAYEALKKDMKIFGKTVSEYFAFSGKFAVLILAIGITRLVLSVSGVPNGSTRWVSMTAAMFLTMIYLGIRAHTSGFGSYRHLLPSALVPNTAAQIVAITGILLGIFTGHDNVFTAPEFAFGADGKTFLHLGAHLFIGMTVGGVVNWLVSCLFFFIAKKVVKGKPV